MSFKLFSSFFAFALALLLFGGTATASPGRGVYYQAQPAAAPAAETLIVRDLVWKCGAGGCVSGASNSRPAVDCSALVRKVGALRSFAVKGEPLAPEALEKCNARAR
ncbi:MAG TPA: hypothetical protein VHM92_12825 [Allosphingosinicella sp.]|nr:hypothetical protein [Allosphingosinicella sp.]